MILELVDNQTRFAVIKEDKGNTCLAISSAIKEKKFNVLYRDRFMAEKGKLWFGVSACEGNESFFIFICSCSEENTTPISRCSIVYSLKSPLISQSDINEHYRKVALHIRNIVEERVLKFVRDL